MSERACENCGFVDDELVLVRRVYVVPETWDQARIRDGRRGTRAVVRLVLLAVPARPRAGRRGRRRRGWRRRRSLICPDPGFSGCACGRGVTAGAGGSSGSRRRPRRRNRRTRRRSGRAGRAPARRRCSGRWLLELVAVHVGDDPHPAACRRRGSRRRSRCRGRCAARSSSGWASQTSSRVSAPCWKSRRTARRARA